MAANPRRLPVAVLLAVVGAAALAVGTWLTLRGVRRPIGPYDEGLLLTDAMLLGMGQTPYRDFYSNYPPGVIQLIQGLWAIFGMSVAVVRWLGFVLHVAIALLAGRLAGRVAERRHSPLAAGLTMVWLSPLGVVPYAYLAGLALLLVTIELWAVAARRRGRGWWIACGAAAALSSWLRHDLLAFFAVMATFGIAFEAWRARAWRQPAWRAAVGWTVAGAAAVVAVTWLPLFLRAGVMTVANDLYFDQVHHVMPARVLPFPPLWPNFIAAHYPAAVVIALSGPALGAAMVALTWRTTRQLTGLVAAAAVAVLPQMLGRSDVVHVLYTVTPAIILACAWVELAPVGGRRALAAAHLLAAVALLVLLVRPAYTSLLPKGRWEWNPLVASGARYPMPRARGAVDWDGGIVSARVQVYEALERVSPPGEPIYVGLLDHRRPYVSEMDLYFLYGRPGSTRIMQFDPNVVNRLDVQRVMVDELERAGTRALILSRRWNDVREPNDGAKPGATYLDEQIRARFRKEMAAGPYELWVRKD